MLCAMAGVLTALACKVTAACASSRPVTVAPVCSVIDFCASTFPSKCEFEPKATPVPPAVTVLHGDLDDPNDLHWIQADRGGRRTEVGGDWLRIYYYIEAIGPLSPPPRGRSVAT